MPIDAGSPFSLQSLVNSSLKTPELMPELSFESKAVWTVNAFLTKYYFNVKKLNETTDSIIYRVSSIDGKTTCDITVVNNEKVAVSKFACK